MGVDSREVAGEGFLTQPETLIVAEMEWQAPGLEGEGRQDLGQVAMRSRGPRN